MKNSRFLTLLSSGLMSITLTHISVAAEVEVKNTPAIPNNMGHTMPEMQSTSKTMASAWNWGGYLRTIQKSLSLGTPDRVIIDKAMELLQLNKASEAREYLMDEFKKNKDYSGLTSFLIGFFYTEGIGGDKDPIQGFNFMKQSATRGFVDGEYQLGRYYANGTGTPVDTLQAVLWYKAASLAGNQDATTNLKYLFLDEKVPDEWITSCKTISEFDIRDKLINARHSFRGTTDRDGNKSDPDLQKALNELNDLVPSCVNPPQEQS